MAPAWRAAPLPKAHCAAAAAIEATATEPWTEAQLLQELDSPAGRLFGLYAGETLCGAAVFQLVSVCTTTGFVSENFNLWPSITLVIILMFMLMGGCAGSTGGGVKVMRLVMLFRLAYLEIFRLLHPHSVRHLKIAGKSVPVEVISGVVGFFLLYLIVTTVGTIVLTVQDMDLVSAFTATLTCISNVGPGLGSVGPVDNFSHVPTLSKWVLTLCMLLGRLEIYAILVLFIPEFWRD